MSQPMRYVIFVPRGEQFTTSLARCLQYAASTEWEPQGVIIGRWDDVVRMCHEGAVEIVIIDDRDHLPPDRIPRLVVVGEELVTQPVAPDPSGEPPPRQRRPRRIT